MFNHYYNSEKPEGAQSSGWLHTAKTVFTGTFLGIVATTSAFVGNLPLAWAASTFSGSDSERDSTALDEQSSGSLATVGVPTDSDSTQTATATFARSDPSIGGSPFYETDYQEEDLPEVAKPAPAPKIESQEISIIDNNPRSEKRNFEGGLVFEISEQSYSQRQDICRLNHTAPIFAVSWESSSDNEKVKLRFCGEYGIPLTDVIIVNTNPVVFVAAFPAIAPLADGSGVVVDWICDDGVCANTVNKNGTVGPAQLTVAQSTGEKFAEPKPFAIGNIYGFIWLQTLNATTTFYSAMARAFFMNGTSCTAPFLIKSDVTDTIVYSDTPLNVACYAENQCAAVFRNGVSSNTDILKVKFSPKDGTLIGPAEKVNNITAENKNPDITINDKKEVRVWQVGEKGTIESSVCSLPANVCHNTQIYKHHNGTAYVGHPEVALSPNGDEKYFFIVTYIYEQTAGPDEVYRDIFSRTRDKDGNFSNVTQVNGEASDKKVSKMSNVKAISLTNKTWVATWPENPTSGGDSSIVVHIMNSQNTLLPGMIDGDTVSELSPDHTVRLTVNTLLNIKDEDIATLPYDITKLSVSSSLTLVNVGTGQNFTEVTLSDLKNHTKVAFTWDGSEYNPKITQQFCKNGRCTGPIETTLSVAFGSNNKQMPLWLIALLVGGGFTAAGAIGLLLVCMRLHSKEVKKMLSAPSRAAERAKNFPSPGRNASSQFSQQQAYSKALSRRPSGAQSDEAQQEEIALSPTG